MTEPSGGGPAPGLIPRPLAIAMTVVAMSVWVLDAVAAVVIPGYMSNPTITTTFVTIASVILGLGRGKADPAPPPRVDAAPPADARTAPATLPDAATPVVSVAELTARLRAEQDQRAPRRRGPEQERTR